MQRRAQLGVLAIAVVSAVGVLAWRASEPGRGTLVVRLGLGRDCVVSAPPRACGLLYRRAGVLVMHQVAGGGWTGLVSTDAPPGKPVRLRLAAGRYRLGVAIGSTGMLSDRGLATITLHPGQTLDAGSVSPNTGWSGIDFGGGSPLLPGAP